MPMIMQNGVALETKQKQPIEITPRQQNLRPQTSQRFLEASPLQPKANQSPDGSLHGHKASIEVPIKNPP
jgi:hypothetical protein